VFDRAADWLIVIGVHLLVGVLFLFSGQSKLSTTTDTRPPR
jgi:hypothetical protein